VISSEPLVSLGENCPGSQASCGAGLDGLWAKDALDTAARSTGVASSVDAHDRPIAAEGDFRVVGC
jgi:hypothetical protein